MTKQQTVQAPTAGQRQTTPFNFEPATVQYA